MLWNLTLSEIVPVLCRSLTVCILSRLQIFIGFTRFAVYVCMYVCMFELLNSWHHLSLPNLHFVLFTLGLLFLLLFFLCQLPPPLFFVGLSLFCLPEWVQFHISFSHIISDICWRCPYCIMFRFRYSCIFVLPFFQPSVFLCSVIRLDEFHFNLLLSLWFWTHICDP
jgi:hypothetical protein